MTVPTSFSDLSTTVASNSPSGSETPADGDNHLRTIYALLASIYGNSGNGWSSPYVASSSLPTLASGTYTPTLTNVANVSASTADVCHYVRVGSQVTVSGSVSGVTCSVGSGTLSSIGVTLPVASNLAASTDLSGSGTMYWRVASVSSSAEAYADTTNDRAEISFPADSTSSTSTRRLSFTFTYTIA